ncbi:hypothetical protein WKK05_00720 [Nostoc sp. UHCC 0302]|uniref:hypothetical protein n=1 Tax=Nostoc sp. UHCC 0302 TaxID=3134896 RepID=UPI00311CA756
MKRSKFLNKTASYSKGQQIDILWSDNLIPRWESQQPELASSAFRHHGSVCLA